MKTKEIKKPIYITKPKLEYSELEDQYWKLKEENKELKKQSHGQEEKIKQYELCLKNEFC